MAKKQIWVVSVGINGSCTIGVMADSKKSALKAAQNKVASGLRAKNIRVVNIRKNDEELVFHLGFPDGDFDSYMTFNESADSVRTLKDLEDELARY